MPGSSQALKTTRVVAVAAALLGASPGCREGPAASASSRPAPVNAPPSATASSAGLAPPEERAFVADVTGLVEVAMPGGGRVLSPGKIDACEADARAGVVWFVRDDGLFAFDLADRRVHLVVEDTPWKACVARSPGRRSCLDPAAMSVFGNARPIFDHGDERLGGEDRTGYFVALVIAISGAPSIRAELGCDGDAGTYCYDVAGDGGLTPNAEIFAKMKAIRELHLADPAYVAALAARGAGRKLWTPSPPRPRAPSASPDVDRAACTELPEACGQLEAIPWSGLWLVVTGNSRGDYFHESRALWDPAARAFVLVDGRRLVHEQKPPPDEAMSSGFAGARVSPRGVLSRAGFVFDATTVHFAPAGEGRTCGFSDGGARLGGHD